MRIADRMMASASVLDEGIELAFVGGCSGLIPFSDPPESDVQHSAVRELATADA